MQVLYTTSVISICFLPTFSIWDCKLIITINEMVQHVNAVIGYTKQRHSKTLQVNYTCSPSYTIHTSQTAFSKLVK